MKFAIHNPMCVFFITTKFGFKMKTSYNIPIFLCLGILKKNNKIHESIKCNRLIKTTSWSTFQLLPFVLQTYSYQLSRYHWQDLKYQAIGSR